MVLAIIGCLIIVAGYLAKRLADARTQNAALQSQVTSLRRKLSRNRS
jgi:hypothetical protein